MWLRLEGNVQQMWSAVKSAIKIEHYSGPERIKIEQGQLHQLLSPPHSRCHRVLQVLAKNSEKQLPALREGHDSFIGLTFVTSIPLRWVISICVWWLLCEVRLWFGLEGYAATRPGGWGSGHRLWPKKCFMALSLSMQIRKYKYKTYSYKIQIIGKCMLIEDQVIDFGWKMLYGTFVSYLHHNRWNGSTHAYPYAAHVQKLK